MQNAERRFLQKSQNGRVVHMPTLVQTCAYVKRVRFDACPDFWTSGRRPIFWTSVASSHNDL